MLKVQSFTDVISGSPPAEIPVTTSSLPVVAQGEQQIMPDQDCSSEESADDENPQSPKTEEGLANPGNPSGTVLT